MVGRISASMAAVITRLRPRTSATATVNGAVIATASALAVMTELISAAPTANSRAKVGNNACGAYRLMNVLNPAMAMVRRRESKDIDAPASDNRLRTPVWV